MLCLESWKIFYVRKFLPEIWDSKSLSKQETATETYPTIIKLGQLEIVKLALMNFKNLIPFDTN